MRITVLTLFPEYFQNFVTTSIAGRAIGQGLAQVDFVQIRDFAHDKYKHVDDTPFGGGAGMIMKCQPVLDALDSVKEENSYVIMTAAAGKKYDQHMARELAQKDHLIILCGHYEGMDERISHHVDEQVSIGDYVLTGGEPACMVIMDSVIRLLNGAIRTESTQEESYENDLLEYPQYTKPADYNGEKVPEVLLSGHHEKIRRWRLEQSLKRTLEARPDLLEHHTFTKEERHILEDLKAEKEDRDE